MLAVDSPAAWRLTVLLTDADQVWMEQLPRLLAPQGVRSIWASNADEALRFIEREPVHAAVVDLALPMDVQDTHPQEGTGGLKLLRVIQRLAPSPPTVVVRGRRFDQRQDRRMLAEALRLEAFSVLDRPVQLEQMLEVLRRLLNRFYAGTWPDPPSSQEHTPDGGKV